MRNSHEIHKFSAHKTHVLIFNFHCISRDCELKWMETGKWHLFKCFHYIFELFSVGITWTTSKWLFQMLLRSVWNKMCIFEVEMMLNAQCWQYSDFSERNHNYEMSTPFDYDTLCLPFYHSTYFYHFSSYWHRKIIIFT